MIAVLVNPKAGYGKPLKYLKVLEDFGVAQNLTLNIYKTQKAKDVDGIKNWLKSLLNIDYLVIIGGDGTLNDFVNSFADDFKIPLLILPCGSGNDFARTLYGKTAILDVLNKLLNVKIQKVDLGVCNGKRFINGIGIGYDGWVAKKANQGFAFLPKTIKYHLTILQGLFFYKSFKTNIGEALIIAACNGKTYGGGYKIAPMAMVSDGLLDICHIHPIKWFKRPVYLTRIKKGQHKDIEGPYNLYKKEGIMIQSDQALPAHLDGEYFCSHTFEIAILKGALNFMV